MTGNKINRPTYIYIKGGAVVAYMQLVTPREVAMAVRMLMAI